MGNADPPFFVLEDVSQHAPYDLQHPHIFETRCYPRYKFDLKGGPPILPIVYPKTPSLFSTAVTADSMGGPQQGGGAAQFDDFVTLFQPNTHRGARKDVTLRTLHDDGFIREGLRISIGPKREPVLARPRLRNDLPDGAAGVWSIMTWLMSDIGPTLCFELSKGIGDFKASSLAWSVMKRAAEDEDFCFLYQLHCQSPFADALVAPQPNTVWNLKISTLADNPFAVKLYRNLKVYATQVVEDFYGDVRYTTGAIAARNSILNVTLPDGEFSELGHIHSPPAARQKAAMSIATKMDPPYSDKYNADSLTVPTDAERQRTMRDVFLSTPLFQVISTIINSAGKTNMAIAMAQLGSEVTVTRRLIPFAALMLETEFKIVARSLGPRVSLAQNYRTLSSVERGRLEDITNNFWKVFTLSTDTHPFYKDMIALGEKIDNFHSLQAHFNHFLFLRKKEETLGLGPYAGLDNLDVDA